MKQVLKTTVIAAVALSWSYCVLGQDVQDTEFVTPMVKYVPKGSGVPLKECEYDCDSDTDCDLGLLCADANKDILEAAGLHPRRAYCWGMTESQEVCFDPTKVHFTAKTQKGQPTSPVRAPVPLENENLLRMTNLPPTTQETLQTVILPPVKGMILGECQGDCDYASDCAEGLVCAEDTKRLLQSLGLDLRTAYCGGTAGTFEICYDPSKLPPTPAPAPGRLVVKRVEPSPGLKLKECERDCDTDSDCATGLLCADGHSAQLAASGLHPKTAYCTDLSIHGDEVCYDPLKLAQFSPNAAPVPTPPVVTPPVAIPIKIVAPVKGMKLGECEGDCDYNSDCAEGLMCADDSKIRLKNAGVDIRTAYCAGDAGFFEVCYDPSKLPPTPAPVPVPLISPIYIRPLVIRVPPTMGMKLLECQSDCDSDSDCAEGLECAQNHSVKLNANGLDTMNAYCISQSINNDEVCYDPTKIALFSTIIPPAQAPATSPVVAPTGSRLLKADLRSILEKEEDKF